MSTVTQLTQLSLAWFGARRCSGRTRRLIALCLGGARLAWKREDLIETAAQRNAGSSMSASYGVAGARSLWCSSSACVTQCTLRRRLAENTVQRKSLYAAETLFAHCERTACRQPPHWPAKLARRRCCCPGAQFGPMKLARPRVVALACGCLSNVALQLAMVPDSSGGTLKVRVATVGRDRINTISCLSQLRGTKRAAS